MQITRSGGTNPTESEDRKSIWYEDGYLWVSGSLDSSDRGIWNVRIDGSSAVRVVAGPIANDGFGFTHEGIYYFTKQPHSVLQFFSFATGKSRPIFTPDKRLGFGMGVSPDGHWLLYCQMDREQGSNLMLVDNFH
jgi:hypothetical protein